MSLIFTKEEISLMKFHKTPNKVLVKPTRGSNEIVLSNGMKIYMDDRFAKEKHAPTTGIIVGHPGNLVASKMPWTTTNEIQVGDYAVYSFESAMYALEELHGRVIFDTDGDIYLFIDYEDIFVVKRNEQIVPINGFLLVSPVELKKSEGFQIVREENNSTAFGVVAYVGKKNTNYLFGGKIRDDVFDFEEEISVGDMIVFNRNSDLPVEYPLHSSLSGVRSENFFRLQRRDIDAVLPQSEKERYGF